MAPTRIEKSLPLSIARLVADPPFSRALAGAFAIVIAAIAIYDATLPHMVIGKSASNWGDVSVPAFDKWLHVICYGGLALATCQALWRVRTPSWHALLSVAISVTAWSGLCEWTQGILEQGRHASFQDLAASALGAILFSLLFWACSRVLSHERAESRNQVRSGP